MRVVFFYFFLFFLCRLGLYCRLCSNERRESLPDVQLMLMHIYNEEFLIYTILIKKSKQILNMKYNCCYDTSNKQINHTKYFLKTFTMHSCIYVCIYLNLSTHIIYIYTHTCVDCLRIYTM